MPDTSDPLLGTVLGGRYRVLRLIGRGGMGAVYAAEQAPLGREVALKVLRPDLAGDDVAIERFRREAMVVGTLGHPHVVGIHDFGTTDDGTLFIAMELLRGEDLAARLRRDGPLGWRRALHIVEQIARALAGAHAKGVVHRDLKPANVILMAVDGADDFVKVVDFGIAKLISSSSSASETSQDLTGGSTIPGTSGYIAPECLAGGTGEDPRSDLYALGVTWFEMLTGRRPFFGESATALLVKQLQQDPPRPTQVQGLDLPAAVEDLLMRLIEREPQRRPPTASALLAELAAVQQRVTSSEAPAGTPSSSRPAGALAGPRSTRWSARAVIVTGAGVAALAAGFAAARLVEARDTDMTPLVTDAQAPPIFFPTPPRAHVVEPTSLAPAPATHGVLGPTVEGPKTTSAAGRPSGSSRSDRLLVAPTPTPTPVADKPVTAPSPALDRDEAWLAEAASVLDSCTESCAKVIAGRLKALDLKSVSPGARAGVDECVSKCRRVHR